MITNICLQKPKPLGKHIIGGQFFSTLPEQGFICNLSAVTISWTVAEGATVE